MVISVLTAAIVALLRAFDAARTGSQVSGWRQIRPSAMHWFGVALGAVLTVVFSYVWLFVGSSRADAESQMAILFWLIIAFGLGTLVVAWTIVSVRLQDLRWRGRKMSFSGGEGTLSRSFDEVADLRETLFGQAEIAFSDGSRLRVDPYAVGAHRLLQAIADDLDDRRP